MLLNANTSTLSSIYHVNLVKTHSPLDWSVDYKIISTSLSKWNSMLHPWIDTMRMHCVRRCLRHVWYTPILIGYHSQMTSQVHRQCIKATTSLKLDWSAEKEESGMSSLLVGKACMVTGQAVGTLHTIEVLQAYQANLLNDSDLNEGVSLDAVHRPCSPCHQAGGSCHRPLSCCNGCHRVASVVKAFRTQGKREYLLLDTLLSSSMLFGTVIETVVQKFRKTKVK